ncbi:isoniazid-inducible protein iniC [Nocardia camponoti]|uniref:Isoniazid-inducible protein iniC n=1 Tax=Nocardia camponoti TaxID=1616106 RepID=A0A917QJS7_9NOCA|nr:isoniazid-inducible protein iniC [Nocardia camponoti]
MDPARATIGGLAEATRLVAAATRELDRDPVARAMLAETAARLRQPLRVALAGSIKAGKSTLLNALVGQSVAPTDATECTRVVTWYRNGQTPTVTAYSADNASANVVVRRGAGAHGLTFDMADLRWTPPGQHTVSHLEVQWPTAELAKTTIIDTPGTSSLSRDVSERTMALLTPADLDAAAMTVPGADAVVYLLRRLDATDVHFLEQLGAGSGALGVVGVVSRADEISAGRINALNSAREVATRFSTELERTGLCQAVIPVAGLLAFAAATLSQPEFVAFETLARLPAEHLELAMLSADRFARPDVVLPVAPMMRAQLLDRFGMFGVRMSVELVRSGVRDAAALARELSSRSGIDELRTVLDVQFGQRADQLKAHSALTTLDRVIRAHPGTSADALLPRIRELLSDVHGFAELRLLGHLRADELPLPPAELAELFRLIGGAGVAVHRRLGLPDDADEAALREQAMTAVRKWRARAKHPLIDKATATACLTAARSAEGALTQLTS